MVDRALISSKLSDLADRIARVRLHRPSTVHELATNRDASDLVAFNLMLAVQTCADIASHLIADEGWPAAKTLGEGFTRLQDQRGAAVHLGLEQTVRERLARPLDQSDIDRPGFSGRLRCPTGPALRDLSTADVPFAVSSGP